jgi:putative endonuclease
MQFSFVHIMTNKPFGTLCIGVTADLTRRVSEHKNGQGSYFAKKYILDKLVWYETFENVETAIQRETSLKRWLRLWKLEMISKANPEWRDLFEELVRGEELRA